MGAAGPFLDPIMRVLKTKMTGLWHRFRAFAALTGVGEIARRYFAMNAFDGVLTIIGVLVGSMTARVDEPRIVLTTGLATSLAMGISGLWGAYLTESAERQREIDDLSRQTLTDLNNTRIGRASRQAVIVVAVVDGISPALAALLVLIPFFLAAWLPAIIWAYAAALVIALCALFGLGVFLGRVSRSNWLVFGLKTLVAGLIAILLGFLLPGD